MVLYACLADPAGMDSGGNMTPQETGSFTIIRGPDGAVTIRSAHPLADGDDDDDDGFTCATVKECWERCMSRCCCRPRLDGGGFTCKPGECEDDGGSGGGGEGGGEGGGGGGGGRGCGDLRDTLSAEYVGKNISNGPWECDKFSLAGSRFIVHGEGIEWGLKHDYYGYVDGSLSGGMAAVEAHFGAVFHINSGYRCPRGNRLAGSDATNSRHVRGRAADFRLFTSRWTTEFKDSIIDWARARWGTNMEAWRYATKSHVHLGWP